MPLNKADLEEAFKLAKRVGFKFIAVEIQMEGYPDTELIVNSLENLDSKLAYYKTVYDDNLRHKFSEGIRIVDWGYGNSLRDIQEELLWHTDSPFIY